MIIKRPFWIMSYRSVSKVIFSQNFCILQCFVWFYLIRMAAASFVVAAAAAAAVAVASAAAAAAVVASSASILFFFKRCRWNYDKEKWTEKCQKTLLFCKAPPKWALTVKKGFFAKSQRYPWKFGSETMWSEGGTPCEKTGFSHNSTTAKPF